MANSRQKRFSCIYPYYSIDFPGCQKIKQLNKNSPRSLVAWMQAKPGAAFSVAAFGPGICTARYAAS
ncbi:MAG: hypothetical protein ACLFUN_08685, partial [Desulfobacterales bacterium]